MGELSIWHWAIVAVVLVLLFGSARLPALARGLGQSLRILRSETREMHRDDAGTDREDAAPPDAERAT